jgi:hypothetical protein
LVIVKHRSIFVPRRRLNDHMNKGKPSGFKADTKKDAGAKSTSRMRSGQAGAGPGWADRKQKREDELVHAGGDGGPQQNAGGPRHHGGNEHEDRNP